MMVKRIVGVCLLLSICLSLGGCGVSPALPATPEPPEMRVTTAPATLTPSPAPSPTPEATPIPPPEFAQVTPTPTPWLKPIGAFSIEDMRVDGVSLHATAQEVEEVFGEPLVREPYVDPATSASFVTYGYDEDDGIFFHLWDGKTLTRATLTTDTHEGPRGLKVGDSYGRVLSVFVRDPEIRDKALAIPENEEWSEGFILYGRDDPYFEGGILPPQGSVTPPYPGEDPTEFYVHFIDPAQPYSEETLKTGTHVFERHGILIFYIDRESLTVKRINWAYSALAE